MLLRRKSIHWCGHIRIMLKVEHIMEWIPSEIITIASNQSERKIIGKSFPMSLYAT